MTESPARVVRVPRWLPPVTLLIAVVGIGVSAYLTAEHFSGSNHLAGCHAGGFVNCTKVTTSPESHILGIPVAVLGLVFFVGAVPFLVPAAWRSRDRRVRGFRQLSAIAGLGFVLWLVYAELIKIHNICEYCTGVHLLTLLLFVLISYGTLVTAPTLLSAGDGQDEDNAAAEHLPPVDRVDSGPADGPGGAAPATVAGHTSRDLRERQPAPAAGPDGS